MTIIGGPNIYYAVDLRRTLLAHPIVGDAAIIGIPSGHWSETPLGLNALKPGHQSSKLTTLDWANGQLNKNQRISAIKLREELPAPPWVKF